MTDLKDEIEDLLMSIVADGDFINAQLGAKAITRKQANKDWLAATSKATQSVLELLESEMLSIIGEDEEHNYPNFTCPDCGFMEPTKIRNRQRSDQRNALKGRLK